MEYFPLGEELTFEQALVQASQTFDLAAMIATEARDADKLLEVGTTWVKLADFMIAAGEHEDKKKLDEKPERDFPVGFASITNDEKEDDVRDESD